MSIKYKVTAAIPEIKAKLFFTVLADNVAEAQILACQHLINIIDFKANILSIAREKDDNHHP